MKRGFTLVELLAVIVILAIILAIAIPGISNIIDSSRSNSFNVSSKMLMNAAKTYVSVNDIVVADGTTTEILYSDIKNAGYISKIVDPISNNECIYSKVYITNTGEIYTYKSALACDNYMDIDAYNLITNHDFSDGTTNWFSQSGTFSVSNQILTNTASGTTYYNHGYQYTNSPIVTGDKIYMYIRARVTNDLCDRFYTSIRPTIAGSYSTINQNDPVINQWYTLTGIVSIAPDSVGNIRLFITQIYPDAATATEKVIQIDGTYGVYAINLTSIYGAGNEPSVTTMNNIMSKMGK